MTKVLKADEPFDRWSALNDTHVVKGKPGNRPASTSTRDYTRLPLIVAAAACENRTVTTVLERVAL